MKKVKRTTYIFEALGFPIRLINVPMKKVLGEWVLDINLNNLQIAAVHMLATKPASLDPAELKFLIDYLEMSTREFAKLLGVTHVAVIKWLNHDTKMNVGTEVYLRLYLLNFLKVSDREFRKIYLNFNPAQLASSKQASIPLEIDAEKIAC